MSGNGARNAMRVGMILPVVLRLRLFAYCW